MYEHEDASTAVRTTGREPIAIVGIGCRFPGGVRSPQDFWELLHAGRDALVEIPAERWSTAKYFDPEPAPGRSRVSRGGFLTDPIDRFDAAFFGISPREADYIDPQQRLMLEVAWEAVEDSGTPLDALAGGPTGVYVGGFTLDYSQLQFSLAEGEPPTVAAHTATGVVMTMLANRLSHAFDFLGPSLAVDTACSSSLVATHLACQSLWNGESRVALAGGVNLMLAPNFTVAASQGGFLSPTSTSRAFDSRANGYVRGEGAAVVVLKPLSAAVRDQDRVYALIRGTAVVQDGRTQGITVPNGASQEAAIARALAAAGVGAESIDFVEAHGTGTPVGDPIEAGAIGHAYRGGPDHPAACLVGSVKTNIGHLEAAAGVAGLVKSALALHHRELPAHLHLERVNPAIDLDALNLRIPSTPVALRGEVLRAGVNSFGFGGTNAHAVLESAPARTEATAAPTGSVRGLRRLLPISARSPEALRALALAYADRVAAGADLTELGSALAHRRTHHLRSRAAVVGDSPEEVLAALQALATESGHPALHLGETDAAPGAPAFVFTGMGPQWWGMARGLLEGNEVFRAAVDRVEERFAPLAGWSLTEALLADEPDSRMAEADVAQPANFAVQVGLVELWAALGVRPAAILGHSAGEVAAAWAAGSLDLDDAVTVIYHRSRLQHRTSGGGRLLAVSLEAAEAELLPAVADGTLELAAVNSPRSVALVGAVEELQRLADELTGRGVFARLVDGNVPYHSRAMDPLEDELRRVLTDLAPQAPRLPLYSSVTGARLSTPQDAAYWWANVRQPVQFGSAAAAVVADGVGTVVELGPQPVLAHALGETLAAAHRRPQTVASLRSKAADEESIAHAAAELYVLGHDLDWSAWTSRRPALALPAYPWQRERYWMESRQSEVSRLGLLETTLLGNRRDCAAPSWRRTLDGTAPAYLADHVVHGAPLFPGAAFAELVLEAAREQYGATSYELRDLRFEAPLVLRRGRSHLIDTTLDPATATVTVDGRAPESQRWVRHAGATVVPAPSGAGVVDLEAAAARCERAWDASKTYARFAEAGFAYGPAFRSLDGVRVGASEAVARLEVDPLVGADGTDGHVLHPVVLDACFQLLLPLAIVRLPGSELIPVGVDRLVVHRGLHRVPRGELHAHATLVAGGADEASEVRGDVVLTDEVGAVLVEVHGFRVRVGRNQAVRERLGTHWLHEPRWEHEDRSEPATGGSGAAEGVWLLLADQGGLAQALAERLAARGGRTLLCTRAPAGDPGGVGGVVARPDRRDQLARAVDAASALGPLRGVVHLWSCDAPGTDAEGELDLTWPLHDAPLSLVHLASELDARGSSARLSLVTRGAQPVSGELTAEGLSQAPLWGMGRVLHHESMGLATRMIDLDPGEPAHDTPDEAGIEALVDELLATDTDEDQVAFRDGQRLVARLHPTEHQGGGVPRSIRADATYLITGGLGALGLVFTSWLVDRGARHLVLTSRTGLPPREEWSGLPADHPATPAVATLTRLAERGADVAVETLEVTDEAATARLLERRRVEGRPPLRGVIHSAGAVSDQLVIRTDEARLAPVLRPKILGGWALHRATQGEALDFFVLCSSVSAVVPTPGQGTYATGNAFLDALAHYRRGRGLPALSIDWGPWDVGMIAELGLGELYRRRGLDLIDEPTGLDVLNRLLGSDHTQQVVVSAHWPSVVASYPLTPRLIEHLGLDDAVGDDAVGSVADQLAAAAPEDRPALVREACASIIGSVLRIEREHLPADEALNRLGLDSMIAAELRIRLEQACGAAPTVVFMLNGATVATIAADITDQLADQLADLPTDQPTATPDQALERPGEGAEVAELADLLAGLDRAQVDALLHEVEPPPVGDPRG